MEEIKPKRNRAQRATAIAKGREKLWEQFPDLIDGLMEQSQNGNANALKTLLDLSGLEKGALTARRTNKTQANAQQSFMERWAKHKQQKGTK